MASTCCWHGKTYAKLPTKAATAGGFRTLLRSRRPQNYVTKVRAAFINFSRTLGCCLKLNFGQCPDIMAAAAPPGHFGERGARPDGCDAWRKSPDAGSLKRLRACRKDPTKRRVRRRFGRPPTRPCCRQSSSWTSRLTTMSSLAAASGLSYGTAFRAIEGLVANSLIVRRSRTATGRSFSLHPSSELLRRWQLFAGHTRRLCLT